MRIVVLKQCQREIEEFPLIVKEQLSDYLELLAIGEVLPAAGVKVARIHCERVTRASDERCVWPIQSDLFDALKSRDLPSAWLQKEDSTY